MRQRVLARELEDFYDHLDAGGALLADTLGAGRDDSRLAALVLELHDKVQSTRRPRRLAGREPLRLGRPDRLL